MVNLTGDSSSPVVLKRMHRFRLHKGLTLPISKRLFRCTFLLGLFSLLLWVFSHSGLRFDESFLTKSKVITDAVSWYDRYESAEAWRRVNHRRFPLNGKRRAPRRAAKSTSVTDASAFEQTLIADYLDDSIKNVFLMLKTGATVLWDRVPVHVYTTFTRFPNFAIYSDKESSIAGYEIIDILRNLPSDVIEHAQLEQYRLMHEMHLMNWAQNPKLLKDSNAWNLDKFKNIPIFADAYARSPDSDWYVLMDDDSYIMTANLADFLKKYDPEEPLYYGSPAVLLDPQFDGTYFNHGGSGVVVSRGAMKRLFGPQANMSAQALIDKYSRLALNVCCGDAVFALALAHEAGVNTTLNPEEYPWEGGRFQGSSIADFKVIPEHWCLPISSWHHLTPTDIETLWQYEHIPSHDGRPLYADIYRDFILPHVDEVKYNWSLDGYDMVIDNETDISVFRDQDGNVINGTESWESCQKVCKLRDCFAWTFSHSLCGLMTVGFSRGKAVNDRLTSAAASGSNNFPVSGWNIARIRSARAAIECDPLQFDENTNTFSDNMETSEGYMLRELRRWGSFSVRV